MSSGVLFFLVAVIVVVFQDNWSANARKLPSFITRCKRTDPKISECFGRAVQALKPHMKEGVPEMGIPPCDPLVIPRLELKQPEGATVGFDAVLTNLTFIGGLDFSLDKVKIDFDKGIFYMEINFPRLVMLSDYVARGKVLIVTFEGEGKAHGDYGNVTLYGTFHDIRVQKNGKAHFKIQHKQTVVEVGTIKVQFENLFKNNPAITENTNKLINENHELLFSEIKPIIEETIGDLVTSVVEIVNERFSIDELFPA